MLTKMAALRFTMFAAMALSAIQLSRGQVLSLPALDQESLPNTNFSCIGKVIGGYYADVYTGCQMFHVCTLDEKGEIHDYKFSCILGTVFDQETRVCERTDEVDCTQSESFFHFNNDLYGPGIIPPTAVHRVSEGVTSGGVDFPTTTQTAFVFPETNFLCRDKVPGGLYADVETGCVVFHICSVGPDSSFTDNKFVCGEGTLFDQKSRTCQAASAVDCSRSESLYYLNDRLKGPEKVVDLCLSQPLGTPLADLTSGCQDYMVCESRADGSISERHHSCKKDYLFSQMRKRCLPSKKVNCVKETLSGILGLDSSKRGKSKKRVTRSLLLHRFRRAALPPLVNIVTNAGIEEDARVRRALYSLAVLRRWALENSRDTTFVEVYTLNTKDNVYPKKTYGESHHLNRYGYLQRKRRDVANITLAEQALHGNQTKAENPVFEPASVTSSSDQGPERPGELIISPTSTLPDAIPTITIPPKTRKFIPPVPIQTLPVNGSFDPSASFSAPPTLIIPTAVLSTITVKNTGPRTTTTTTTTTVTVPASTSTVTVTKTVAPEDPKTATPDTIVNTVVPTVPQTDVKERVANSTLKPDVHQTGENSTPSTQGLSTSKETVEIVTHSTPAPSTVSSAGSTTSSSSAPQDQVEENTTPVEINTVDVTTVSSPNSTLAATDHSGPENITITPLAATVQSVPEDITTTPATTSLQVEAAVTEASTEIANATVSTNVTTTTTVPSITKVEPPQGSVNASTTVLPSDVATNASMTPVTQAPPPTIGPYTKDNLPETNFTCKGKKLEQFYPDTEANCQVFHYCSPGFQDTQILDLKFLCTGDTMFDVNTQKCENKSIVTCASPPVTNTTSVPTPVTNITTSSSIPPLNTTTSPSTTPVTNTTTSPPTTPAPPVTNTTTSPATTSMTNTTTTPPETTVTLSSHVTTVSVMTETTTEHLHENWNATSKSSQVHSKTTENQTIHEITETLTADSNHTQTSENPQEVDRQTGVPIVTTAESLTVESDTEVSPVEIETVTARFAREEIPTVTSNINEIDMTTEFILEEEDALISTELGPLEGKSEPMTDIPVHHASTTNSAPPLSSAAPLQISSSSISPPALNNTNISISVMNITTTEVSKNTNTETPL